MKGSEYVAKFLKAIGVKDVYLVQGGACAFMVDAVSQEEGIDYKCFQHEQAAAMAADAVWRTSKTIGATFCTSGPGASNLLTGIACGYYDSIPSIHITGQVNGKEQAQYRGAKVRQAGFQQMDIVSMVQPVCNYAVAVTDAKTLRKGLKNAVEAMFRGRMGPVLVDIPMDVQTDDVGEGLDLPEYYNGKTFPADIKSISTTIRLFLSDAKRPLVVFGAGVELAGVEKELEQWLNLHKIPFVASWSALNSFDHDNPLYCGHFGVYGNRGGNYLIQNADKIIVFGSRLDNRQRSGNTKMFAPSAKILVCDIDFEELYKYDPEQYAISCFDLARLPDILNLIEDKINVPEDWKSYVEDIRGKYLDKDISMSAATYNSVNPYTAIKKMSELFTDDAILFTDAGANHVWMFQAFKRKGTQSLITSSGHYAMGYSLPAAIGAKLVNPDKQVISFNGDGGIQMNIQELQTLVEYDLDVKVVVFNNKGLGMIKQFQDTYMGSRYEATGSGKGPGRPNFAQIAIAYDLDYHEVTDLNDIRTYMFTPGRRLIEIVLDERTLIEPKLEMGRPINDQFPYVSNEEFDINNQFVKYTR